MFAVTLDNSIKVCFEGSSTFAGRPATSPPRDVAVTLVVPVIPVSAKYNHRPSGTRGGKHN